MPTHATEIPVTTRESEVTQNNVACPTQLSHPSELDDLEEDRSSGARHGSDGEDGIRRRTVGDNTAAGMSLAQEDSMYTAAPFFDEKSHVEQRDVSRPVAVDLHGEVQAEEHQTTTIPQRARSDQEEAMGDVEDKGHGQMKLAVSGNAVTEDAMLEDGLLSPPLTTSPEHESRSYHKSRSKPGVAAIDQELEWAHTDTKPWEFSHRRNRPQYPSATFQSYSKFKGTQQSDRQIYNVEVTILTVDIEQCSMSGYLQICGLTPDHPTLTTFFTGEIIGGPDQKYSFRTKDASWGASDKTDLTHWARFPAWRPLSLHAKRNINFVYPVNHEDWWQQEYIFMRWKEHFLVPDYKLKSIQGASFEGFYYICFNQIQGRVSGIYFHSKSEKYQQLELTHEGKPGIWGRGVCPSIESR